MQKITNYLYSNRIQLLANLESYYVEYTNVYQKPVKIYNGIDNTLEFDVKNADQKRIDLMSLSNIQMTVMDAAGYELPNSPYQIMPVPALKGIATVTIPQEDLTDLIDQFLRYSVTAVINNKSILLYADTRFGGSGTMELIGTAMPIVKDEKIYNTFTAEIDLQGVPVHHSSAIPVTFYESIPTKNINFDIQVKGFVGSIWIEATKQGAISSESFKQYNCPFGAWTQRPEDGIFTGIVPYGFKIPVQDFTYFRISYQTPNVNGIGASFYVSRDNNVYDVTIRSGGTGYSVGSQIKIPGSQLGGIDDTNDLLITVIGVNTAGSSSYVVSSITSISWSGIANTGTANHLATGINYTGMVEKILVY